MNKPTKEAGMPGHVAAEAAGVKTVDTSKAERAARLAAALRANLRRRKVPGAVGARPARERN